MGTYHQLFYQIVFGPKDRRPVINPAHDKDLYKFIWGVTKKNNCTLYQINGIEDHIHIASHIHPSICISDFVKDIKTASSRWMKECGMFPAFEGWQAGYGAFTYSNREKDMIIKYVKNQKTHHKKETFYDEFKRLLIENGIAFD